MLAFHATPDPKILWVGMMPGGFDRPPCPGGRERERESERERERARSPVERERER